MQKLKEIRYNGTEWTENMIGFGEAPKTIFSMPEEVITVHSIFFKKPYYKQRAVLRLLIWWGIKHYFKILFKK